ILVRVGYGLDPDGGDGAALADALARWKLDLEDPRFRFDAPMPGPAVLLALPGGLLRLARRMRRVRRIVAALPHGRGGGDGASWIARLRAAGLSVADVADEVAQLYWAYDAVDYV